MKQKTQMYGVSDIEQGTLVKPLPDGAEVRHIYIDTKNPIDRTFEEFGHLFYNPLVQNGHGNWVPSNMQYWEQDGDYRALLNLKTPVYPLEAVEQDFTKVLNEHLTQYKWYIHDRAFTNRGFTGYWTIMSPDIRQIIKGSYEVGDEVQVGVTIRNGIGTGIALGADFYTYRLNCMNGALGRGTDFGSISIRHVGDRNKIIEAFKEGIPLVVKMGQKILEYYEMATAFKFDEKMAKRIFKNTPIALKYFPEYFELPDNVEGKKSDEPVTLTAQGKSLTLWEVFNDLTEPLTKSYDGRDPSGRLGFTGFRNCTKELHRCLVKIVDAKRSSV